VNRPPTHIALALLVLLGFLAASPAASHAFQKELKSKQSQLEKLRKEISDYEKKIRSKEKKENLTLGQLDNYNRQETVLKKLIRRLRREEEALAASIDSAENSVSELTARIDHLKKTYAGYVRSAYMRGTSADLELLLGSGSLNQLIIRAEYLRRFSARRKSDLAAVTAKKMELEEQQEALSKKLNERKSVLADKSAEQGRLKTMTKKKKNVLAAIRKDKKKYQQEIDRRKKDFQVVEKKIAALIEKEKKRKAAPGGSTPAEIVGGGPFEAAKGRLRWPVAGGKVLARYGKQQHPVLHTITDNKGIDIGVSTGSSIATVASGEVSTIWWLPSYGNLVIVAHDGGYRTVYAHLAEIAVEEGQKVTAGQTIGQSGEGIEGPMVHFEVWRGRETQDPLKWLSPRDLTKQ
jgi:septal ring factor EnvC (AmiA/AmiB activator)